jgi:hypothetical protein
MLAALVPLEVLVAPALLEVLAALMLLEVPARRRTRCSLTCAGADPAPLEVLATPSRLKEEKRRHPLMATASASRRSYSSTVASWQWWSWWRHKDRYNK